MIKANFNTYNNYITDSVYQWDINQDLEILGLNLAVAPEIHFANANMDRAIVKQSKLENGVVTVRIPNSLLQTALAIKAYVGVYEGDTFKIIETIEIPVTAKARPYDYALEDTDEEIYSFKKLENELANAQNAFARKVEESTDDLTARLNLVISNGTATEGNAELLDIRVGTDGTIYDTAGEAIRTQFQKLSENETDPDGETNDFPKDIKSWLEYNGGTWVKVEYRLESNVFNTLSLRISKNAEKSDSFGDITGATEHRVCLARIAPPSDEFPNGNWTLATYDSTESDDGFDVYARVATYWTKDDSIVGFCGYGQEEIIKNYQAPTVVESDSFDYTKYDVPVVYINGDFDSIKEKTDLIKCDYSYVNSSTTKTGFCTAKWQGSSSLNYPKKNFTIKFYTDADCSVKDSFEAKTGWGAEYKYCFKADWIDCSHSRNVVSAELWGDIVRSRKDINTEGSISYNLNQSANGGAIDGFPIFLVINGEWQGIYNWNIPKDDWTLSMGDGIGQKEVILCASGDNTANFYNEAVVGVDFDLEYATDEKDENGNQKPETMTAVQNSLNNLIRLVKNSDGSNIDTEIAKYLDIQSAIDYFLFVVLIDNYDGVLKNYLLGSYDYETTEGYGKWFFGAYDLDSVFGMTTNGKPTSDGQAYRPFTYGHADVVASSHKLFSLLWTYKKEDILTRYKELIKNSMSLATVTTKFCNYVSKIPQSAYDADARKWTGLYNTSTNNLTQIISWYENRLDLLNTKLLGNDGGESWGKIGTFTLTPQEVTVTDGQTEIPITLQFLDGIAVYHNDTVVSSDKYTIDTDNKKLVLNGYSVTEGDTIKIQNELSEVSASDVTVGTKQIGRLGMVNNLKEFELFVDFPIASSNIAIDGGVYNYQYRMFQIYTGSAISTTANTFTLKGVRDKGKWDFKINKDTTANMKGAGYKKAIPEHDSPRLFDSNIFNKPVTNIRVTTSPTTNVFPQGTTFTLYGVEE